MQINTRSLFVFSLITAICNLSLANSSDNYHDQKMALKTQDANKAKAIIDQHKSRIKAIKDDAATKHRQASEQASQKRSVARKITQIKQRNARLKVIDQEVANLHVKINADKKARLSRSADLKTSQLKASREHYTKQLDTLEQKHKQATHKTSCITHKDGKTKCGPVRKSKTATKQQPNSIPRRAFSKGN